MTQPWLWIPTHLVVSWHARLIEVYGGAPGIRDITLLEGALARPINRFAYQPEVSAEQLAALYAVAIAKAHAFIDGNKRIAFAVMVSFLAAHELRLDAREKEASEIMIRVASGEVDEVALTEWLRQFCRRDSMPD